ncbi:hypothetical protein PMZ80_006963 [Knufia obscura]|uniref:JmjC domain-containing protein n=2 Tax=Knufia TaxID=430999 RepID=A0AAN8IRV3_9EURO|nr:hypothetical protein PMZ80_006963 [Knufia obscura]KAK5957502.1 hypothetical protein OHC33_001877 [Knufia fluminis]
MSSEALKKHLLTLLQDYRDFNSAPIKTQPIPTAIEFCKQVSKGYPCIYRAYDKTSGEVIWTDPSLLESPAFTWTKQDLLKLVEDKVEVAVTPNGRADDLHHIEGKDEVVFLSPATLEMTITELFDKLVAHDESMTDTTHAESRPVYYLQSQNSNLTTTSLSPILRHVPQNFSFAQPVLADPEATNIWIGDERSVTSTHRDPYENLYLVLKGSKTFTLFPPVDEITLPTQHVLTGNYTFDSDTNTFSTTVNEDQPRIPWVSADPLLPRDELIKQYPLYEHASPRTVTVREGEILYLPSGWYHHVQQECGIWSEDGTRAPCIAVNYWFDMEYEGEKYVMRQLLGRLVEEMQGDSDAEKR